MTAKRALVALFALLFLSGCGASASYDSRSYESGYGAQSAPSPREERAVVLAAESAPAGGGLFDDFGDYEMDVDKKGAVYAEAPPPAKDEPPAVKEPEAPKDNPENANDQVRRIVLYSAQMGITVLEIQAASSTAVALNEALGGWTQASTSTSLTLRVPAEHFEELLDGLRALGVVTEENVVGQDVTEEYFDLEIRLRNAMEMRARYVALLEKATSVKEALAIEAELGRITGEIERMKGRLRFLQANAAHSTVTVTFFPSQEAVRQRKHVELPFPWMKGYNVGALYQSTYYY